MKIAVCLDFDSNCAAFTGHLPEISLQHKTYVRSNYSKENIKYTDFPAEAPKSNYHKYQAGNADHSVNDLPSQRPKERSLTEISEPYDRTKNDGGTNQAKKHRAHDVFVVPYQW